MRRKGIFQYIREWLRKLSFKTGLIVLGAAVLCYIISFAQAALPIGIAIKGMLWVIFFGLAKTFQYAGLLIIGREGIRKLKTKFKKKDMVL